MITRIAANDPRFTQVEFGEGLNVVLAERTQDSTRRDSRNGLGKTTLIEIIHFALGANKASLRRLAAEQLQDWYFEVDLSVRHTQLTIRRDLASAGHVMVTGDSDNLPLDGESTGAGVRLEVRDWNRALGALTFGLPVEGDRPYQPSYRSLIGYFSRLGRDAYSTPFDFHRRQKEVSRQVSNAFLLGLAWEDAAEWQTLRDRKDAVRAIRQASATGALRDWVGTAGELQAELVRAESRARALETQLASFRVHPQYADVQRHADDLTEQIHGAANANVADSRLLDSYREALTTEAAPDLNDLIALYAEAGTLFPDAVSRTLGDAQQFHQQVVTNRRSFISAEIARLESELVSRNRLIEEASDERARMLAVLQTHGALDEYTTLQNMYVERQGEVDALSRRLRTLQELADAESAIRVDQELLFQRAEIHQAERAGALRHAIEIFNSNSEALYDAPGNLVVDVQPTGFKFNVEILRSESQGVTSMKVFCYDLTIAQLWAERGVGPGFLIHDSTIFEGVDERQVAEAIELAAAKSEEFGFQYICAMNSDSVPYGEFTEGFRFEESVRARLTDREASGSLLGFRY